MESLNLDKLKIKKVDIDGTSVYVKKDSFFGGYRIVFPLKDENGKWIKSNIVGKRFWITLIIAAVIALLFWFGINQLIAQYKDVAFNPCKYCIDCVVKSDLVKPKLILPTL